jgi:hypothetical protein
MAEETTGDEEDDAGASTEARVQEPESGGRHFLEKTADPTDEIICGKEGQIIDTDDGGGQCGGRDPRVKRERNRSETAATVI